MPDYIEFINWPEDYKYVKKAILKCYLRQIKLCTFRINKALDRIIESAEEVRK